MPNHVKNVITLEGDSCSIKKLMEQVSEDSEHFGLIDFQKITPMPESLDIEQGSKTDLALKCFDADEAGRESIKKCKKLNDEQFSELRELGRKYFRNQAMYGHPTWYGWRLENWGTKWNAYDRSCDDDNEFSFNTAWSASHPIIEKIAQMFPDVQITHKWADEDIGSNCGCRKYENGELVEEWFPDDGRETIEFACGMWGLDVDEYIAELEAEGNEVSWK